MYSWTKPKAIAILGAFARFTVLLAASGTASTLRIFAEIISTLIPRSASLRLSSGRVVLARPHEDKLPSPHLADWIKLALHTGCRKGELLGLEWQRVDLHQRVIHLEAHHNKSKRRQTIRVNEEARNALISRARFRAQYCPSTPWVFADKAGRRIKDIKKAFASACRRAGITDFRPHDLRHTCASWLVMRNVPLATVKAESGA